MHIPELLKTLGGQDVTTVEEWETFRRGEILDLYQNYVYGTRDIERPEDLHFVLKSESESYGMRVKELDAAFGDYSFPFRVYYPAEKGKKYPAFVYVMHENLENHFKVLDDGNMYTEELVSSLPLKDITDRGFAIAVMPTRDIYREWTTHSNFEVGVFTAYKNPKPRQKNSWATISAWAWGVSRIVDYFETDDEIDMTHIASTGHSRSGKTALWAGATDTRIQLVAPNNSGCGGAAIFRGKKGEHIKNISVTDWFCDKFRDYSEREEFLPVDQHMVLSLVAPRYLYVTDSILDEWADPDAELLACKLASPAYELYGLHGLVMDDEAPVLNKVYQNGHIAFHVKEGDHSQLKFDWDNLMDYFEDIIEGNI